MTGPQQYRKKPVVIEAAQWDPTNPGPVMTWLRDHRCHFAVLDGGRLGVGTLESGADLDRHAGKPGDYVIRGVAGEFYVCDADVFAQTYDPA
jgi:hypothetical protein